MNRISTVLRWSLMGLVLFVVVPALCVPVFAQTSETPLEPEHEEVAHAVHPPSDSGLYQTVGQIPESIQHSAPFARVMSEMIRKAGTSGTFDVAGRLSSFEQSRRDLERSAVAQKGGEIRPLSDAWTNVGLIGSSSSGVYTAGCTSALAIDPSNPSIMYAAGTSGGIWKSTNTGSTWTAMTDDIIPNLAIASLAIDPSNPNVLYAGTGNGYSGIDELTGTGLWKSTNSGATWARIGTSTFSGTVVNVLVHPTKSNIVFASLYSGGTPGLYRSTDTGATWTRVYSASGNGKVWDVVSGSTIGSTTIFYFVEGNNLSSTQSECGIYKSVNEGASWSKITANPLPAGGRIGRAGLAVAQYNPSRVFCLMANVSGDTLGFYRSTDNGGTWSSVGVPSTLFKPTNSPSAQGWYDLALAVSPYSTTNHDTMYVGGVEGWVNSSDANGWVMFTGYSNQLPVSNPHVDIHTLVVNPASSRTVYCGCDGGLYYSTNAAASWGYRSTNMITGRFYHLGFNNSDYKTTWAGAQDQGTWKMVTSATPVQRLGGDGFQPIQSWGNSSVIYGELPQGLIFRTNNGGSSWSNLSGSFNDNSGWDVPFKMGVASLGAVHGYDILYEGRQQLWRSTDGGDTWGTISGTFPKGMITAIGISQLSENNIYVGFHGGVEYTTDAGTTWTAKNAGVPSTGTITSIVTTGSDPTFALASVYVGSTSYARVLKTTNNGTLWTNVSGTSGAMLPGVGVNCVALDSINPKTTWYAATDNGIYYTLDAGAHWSVAGSGLGLAPCRDVQVHPNKITIRVATFGRGIWEGNVNILPVEWSSLEYQKIQAGTMLRWHTDSERGNAGFWVERSIDGSSVADIAFVPGHGTSSTRQDYAYTDTTMTPGTYIYRLKQVDLDGTEHFSNVVELHYGNAQMTVYQAYPNPFLLGTPSQDVTANVLGDEGSGITPALQVRMRYELPDDDVVSLRIFDARGNLVKTLYNHASQSAGEQDAFWSGDTDSGSAAAAGVYFWVLESAHHGSFTNKIVLLRN